jgi:hypothetical protein
VEAAFVDFLIEGVEPPWLARRPRERTGGGEPDDTGGPPASREDEMEEAGQRTLELPFD